MRMPCALSYKLSTLSYRHGRDVHLMCVPSRMFGDGKSQSRELTPVNTVQAISTKPAGPHEDTDEAEEQAGDWPDSEGLSGQGSESALAHLRDIESRRIDNTEKAH